MLCFRTLCVLGGGGICRPRVNGLARVDERGACLLFQHSLSWACGMHCLLHKVMMLEFMYTHTLKSQVLVSGGW